MFARVRVNSFAIGVAFWTISHAVLSVQTQSAPYREEIVIDKNFLRNLRNLVSDVNVWLPSLTRVESDAKSWILGVVVGGVEANQLSNAFRDFRGHRLELFRDLPQGDPRRDFHIGRKVGL